MGVRGQTGTRGRKKRKPLAPPQPRATSEMGGLRRAMSVSRETWAVNPRLVNTRHATSCDTPDRAPISGNVDVPRGIFDPGRTQINAIEFPQSRAADDNDYVTHAELRAELKFVRTMLGEYMREQCSLRTEQVMLNENIRYLNEHILPTAPISETSSRTNRALTTDDMITLTSAQIDQARVRHWQLLT